MKAVPTNIITGFLGVGKTSTILHLLSHKPPDERWAVLVNEFGEIGVDGSLFQGRYSEEAGIFIREVPGGCMCCSAGLSMQVALSLLIARARPDRILIEPTGLGHPIEVLQVLSGEHYRTALSIEKTLTLVDARQLTNKRYTDHAVFNQQIMVADIVVGNKQDRYGLSEQTLLESYVRQLTKHSPDRIPMIVFAEHGVLKPELLAGKTAADLSIKQAHQSSGHRTGQADQQIPASGYLKASNHGEGFESVGWRFDPSNLFDRDSVFEFLSGLSVERMKAVFITGQGVFGYNLVDDALTEIELDDCLESRIEIIASEISDDWDAQLFACMVNA